MTPVLLIAAAAFIPMIVEALVSRRHDRILRSRGAVEPPDDVIGTMQFAYPAAFACVAVEAWLRQITIDSAFASGAVVFGAAKALKYWAIASLGYRWTFRVLVPPDSVAVRSGPYRFVRHPNYVAVIGELIGAALMAHAWVSGPLVVMWFALLILARIGIEERALGVRK